MKYDMIGIDFIDNNEVLTYGRKESSSLQIGKT